MRRLSPLPQITIAVLLLIGLAVLVPKANAQSEGRTVRLTLLPNYLQGTVDVDGSVSPPGISKQSATLSDWGLGASLQAQQNGQEWHIYGSLPGGELTAIDEEGGYRLSIGPLSLAPGDSLRLTIPFANLHWSEISPPPDNLAQLTGPARPPLPVLHFEGGPTGRKIQLDILFTPIRKKIDLTLIPLAGEVLAGHSDSFRLSGQVTFENIQDFTEFERHCENNSDAPFFRYRAADLLFALDYPPVLHFGFLNPVYQFKPTYTLLRSDLLACQYNADTGQVQAQFSGRVFHVPPHQTQFPDILSRADVLESHRLYTGFGASAGEYELKLGKVILAPGDVLRVTMPHTNIHSVSPPPTRFEFSRAALTQIEYEGPNQFALTVRYTPDSELLLRQAPATGRAFLAPLEIWLGPLLGRQAASAQRLWAWTILIVGIVAGASASRLRGRPAILAGYFGWLLLSAALFYGVRGVFGWLLLAVCWYFLERQFNLLKGIGAVITVLLALLIDAQSEALFAVLSTIELELTPLTPLILGLLSAALYALPGWRDSDSLQTLSLSNLLPIIFFLFTLSIYDALQKSFPALLLIAGGAAFVGYRLYRASIEPQPENQPNLTKRLQLVRQSWLVPGGVLLFTIFAMQHNLQQTAAIFGPWLGLWGPVFIPALLFISVLLAFSAIALLFIFLYPVLPFRAGYLKALVLGLFLLAVFVLGVGSDDRLITALDSLLVGRLIYYLSVPLLVGLYFDIDQFRHEEDTRRKNSEEEAKPGLSFKEAAGLYLKQLRGIIGTAGSILSLVAPSLYAFLFDRPIVTSYFDLLELLISLSV